MGDGEVGVSSLCMLCKEKYLVNLLSYVSRGVNLIRSVSVIPIQLTNLPTQPLMNLLLPHAYNIGFRVTPRTKFFLLVPRDSLNPQCSFSK